MQYDFYLRLYCSHGVQFHQQLYIYNISSPSNILKNAFFYLSLGDINILENCQKKRILNFATFGI